MFEKKMKGALALAAILALAAASCRSTGSVVTPKATVKPSASTEKTLEKVEASLATDDLAAAEASLRTLAAAKGDPRLSALHAAVLLSQGRIDEAEAEATGLLAKNPADAEALYVMSAVKSARGDVAGRKSYLNATLAADPGHPSALSDYGDIWFDASVWVKADESYRKALVRDPANPGALLGLSRLAFKDGKYKDAEDRASQAIESSPTLSISYIERGRARYQEGNYEGAKADLDAAVRLDPSTPWNYIERARIELDHGDRDGALADFGKSIELNPGYFLPYVYRAGMYEEAGKAVEALADYKKIVQVYPEYYYAYESIGFLGMETGDWAGARDAFLKAMEASPGDWDYLLFSLVASGLGGDGKQVQALASKWLPKIDREAKPLDWLLVRLFAEHGDSSDTELAVINEKKMDNKALAIYFLAEYWASQGKTDLADKYFLQVSAMKREGTIADRVNKAAMKRLGLEGAS